MASYHKSSSNEGQQNLELVVCPETLKCACSVYVDQSQILSTFGLVWLCFYFFSHLLLFDWINIVITNVFPAVCKPDFYCFQMLEQGVTRCISVLICEVSIFIFMLYWAQESKTSCFISVMVTPPNCVCKFAVYFSEFKSWFNHYFVFLSIELSDFTSKPCSALWPIGRVLCMNMKRLIMFSHTKFANSFSGL